MRVRRTTTIFAAVTVFMLAADIEVRAAEPHQGWFVWLDVANTQPNSLDQHYANNADFVTNQVNLLSLENDSDISFRIGGGYSWGEMGGLKVSYWTFDNEDADSGTAAGGLIPTVFGYGAIYTYQYLYDASFEAKGGVTATAFDVDYVRSFTPGNKMTVSWLAGLRVATFEEDLSFTGTDATYTYVQKKKIENQGWGPRLGVNLDWGFTDRFSIGGGIAYSFMQVNSEGDASQACPACPYEESLSVKDDYVRGLILDLDLRAMWHWDAFGIWVGYAMSDWGGISTDPFPASSSFVGPTGHRGRDDVSFNSWHTGIKWKFGGGS